VNAAECLKRKQTCILDELTVKASQKEVVRKHVIALPELYLSAIEVKVDVQAFD